MDHNKHLQFLLICSSTKVTYLTARFLYYWINIDFPIINKKYLNPYHLTGFDHSLSSDELRIISFVWNNDHKLLYPAIIPVNVKRPIVINEYISSYITNEDLSLKKNEVFVYDELSDMIRDLNDHFPQLIKSECSLLTKTNKHVSVSSI